MQPKHILYVIGCFRGYNTGNGGHYHSLRTLAEAYSKHQPQCLVTICSVGHFPPAALSGLKLRYRHVTTSPRSLLTSNHKLFDYAEESPTHIHAFDRRSLYFSAVLAKATGAKIYLTKPGGPNTKYFPAVPDAIFFSTENLHFVQARRPHPGCRLHYVPQRVSPTPPDYDRIAALRRKISGSGHILMRVSRIGAYYMLSNKQTLDLARALRRNGVDVRAVIIGAIQDNAALDELNKIKDPVDQIITDQEFTHRADRLLTAASFVVGTGRSLMEAAMAGIPVLAPVAGAKLPELVSNSNVNALQTINFSERYQSSSINSDRSVCEVVKALNDNSVYNKLRRETAEFADRLFNINTALPQYDKIYSAKQSLTLRWTDSLMLRAGVARALVKR